jgi:hypothetical protein
MIGRETELEGRPGLDSLTGRDVHADHGALARARISFCIFIGLGNEKEAARLDRVARGDADLQYAPRHEGTDLFLFLFSASTT